MFKKTSAKENLAFCQFFVLKYVPARSNNIVSKYSFKAYSFKVYINLPPLGHTFLSIYVLMRKHLQLFILYPSSLICFKKRVVPHWNRLSGEVMDVPSLKVFKDRLEGGLSNLV